jgi:hypothetical protein
MKITRSPHYGNKRRRNPLLIPVIIAIILFAAALMWFWHRGGPQPQKQVEKAIPTERLGH